VPRSQRDLWHDRIKLKHDRAYSDVLVALREWLDRPRPNIDPPMRAEPGKAVSESDLDDAGTAALAVLGRDGREPEGAGTAGNESGDPDRPSRELDMIADLLRSGAYLVDEASGAALDKTGELVSRMGALAEMQDALANPSDEPRKRAEQVGVLEEHLFDALGAPPASRGFMREYPAGLVAVYEASFGNVATVLRGGEPDLDAPVIATMNLASRVANVPSTISDVLFDSQHEAGADWATLTDRYGVVEGTKRSLLYWLVSDLRPSRTLEQ
jgi:hypothetical protein